MILGLRLVRPASDDCLECGENASVGLRDFDRMRVIDKNLNNGLLTNQEQEKICSRSGC